MNTIYDIDALDIYGNSVSLNDYRGKVLLIVNTASECGYTQQLESLQKIYTKYCESGFEILAFPSNDFGNQEPLTNESLIQFCKKEYAISFPVFSKIHVKGSNIHPLYQFLSSKKLNGKIQSKPNWNFHKYLINKQGDVCDYFFSFTKPDSNRLIKRIEMLLVEKN